MVWIQLETVFFVIPLMLCLVNPGVTQYRHRVISVGIFSICRQEESSQSQFNRHASRHEKLYSDIQETALIQLKEVTNETYSSNIKVDFVSYDVCNSTERLLEVLTEISLNETYFCRPNDARNEQYLIQNIFALHAYVPKWMSKIIKEYTSSSNFVKLCSPYDCDERYLLQNSKDSAKHLLQFMQRLEWENLTLVLISDKGVQYPWKKYYEDSYSLLKKTNQFCLQRKYFDIPAKNFTRTLIKLVFPFIDQASSNNSTLIFFYPSVYHTFVLWKLRQVKNHNLKVVLHDYTRTTYGVQPNWLTINNKMRGRLDGTLMLLIDNLQTMPEEQVLNYAVSKMMHIRLILAVSSIKDAIQFAYDILKGNNYSYVAPISEEILSLREMSSFNIEERLAFAEKFLNSISNDSIHCRKTSCRPGYENKYGLINGSSTHDLFDETHGWKCQFCPQNHINPNPESNGGCTPCTGAYNVDDGHRVKCIDPYTDQYFVFTGAKRYTIVGMSIVGLLLATFFLLVFFKHRTTPTVKVSDLYISLFHLFVLQLTVCCAGVVYLLPTQSTRRCIYRNLFLTISYSLNVGLVFAKSQKLLNAFLSSVRLRSNAVTRTMAAQIFTVSLFVLLSNVALAILYIHNEPELIFVLYHENMKRLHYCNTGPHSTMLVLLMTLYQLLCFIQAFRGRHLPGPMNNAMSLVYGTMITTMTFAISFPISYFRDVYEKDFIQYVIVLFNCIVILLFLYGKPCFIIIFKPHKNTKQYFSQKSLVEMSIQVGLDNKFH